MQSHRIAITGASGLIGRIVVDGLDDWKVSRYSLPWCDLRKYGNALRALANQDMVIHLAWNRNGDNMLSHSCNSDNTAMFNNVYLAAIEKKVKRVIVASSVHVEDLDLWRGPELLTVDRTPDPATAYGVHKIFLENLGRHYSRMGIEVVCIRFGGVHKSNVPPNHSAIEAAVFLSHEDCISVIKAAVSAKEIPGGFLVLYAVSDNANRMHDITNAVGWEPIPRRK
jgi:nucleoside-diphosphate-sugar epimerase